MARVRSGKGKHSTAVKNIRTDDVLDVALRLFRERGYAGTSLRDIADECGFSQASLYHRFRAKRDLLEALARPLFADVDALLAAVPRVLVDRSERIELLSSQLDLMLTHAPLAAWLLNDPGVRSDEAVWHRILDHERQLSWRLGGGPGVSTSEEICVAAALAALAAIVARLYAHVDETEVSRSQVRHAALTAATALLDLEL